MSKCAYQQRTDAHRRPAPSEGKAMKNSSWLPRDTRITEALAWICAIASLVITVVRIPQLPDTIPTHFDINGTPNGWGSPTSLLALPIIILIVNAAVSLIVRKVDPKYWNRPGTLQPGDEQAWYKASARGCTWTELECSLFCLLLQFDLLEGRSSAVIPLAIALLIALGVTFYVLMKPFYTRKQKDQAKDESDE